MRAYLLILAAGVLAGCSSAPAPFPPSSSNPAHLSSVVAMGRSTELTPGHPHAFWIWREGDDLWHLRTTAKRISHRFQGIVRPMEGAEIIDFRPVSMDSNDRAGMVGRSLSFDFHTHTNIDGFDFRLKGAACLEFDLRLDEDGTPLYIYLGKDKIKPESSHFLLCH